MLRRSSVIKKSTGHLIDYQVFDGTDHNMDLIAALFHELMKMQ